MKEIWKPIPGTAGTYEVSNLGRVRSVTYTDVYGRRRQSRILSCAIGWSGYPTAWFGKNAPKRCALVHRLVAAAFVPNPAGLPEVNHLDGVKTNTAATNLEWCNRSHNVKHAIRTGLNTKPPNRWLTRRAA